MLMFLGGTVLGVLIGLGICAYTVREICQDLHSDDRPAGPIISNSNVS